MLEQTTLVTTPLDRLATFFDVSQPRDAYEDAEIDEIARLLDRCSNIASRTPRLYIILRVIGELEVLSRLLNEGFDDQWFPVESYGLPQFLTPSVKARIVQNQSLVLTKSLDLERGRHRHFKPGEALPFEILSRLGTGGYGQVDRIESKISFRHYALKRIRRRQAFGINSKEAMKRFLSEIQIVKALSHRHVIEYVGSYTDKTYLGLVMSPVADTDLSAFLDLTAAHVGAIPLLGAENPALRTREIAIVSEMCATLRTYFGCLAAALAHLHDRSIRHKDIKPQNILVHKGNVLLADFGLSHEFADDVGSTTSGVTAITPRYSAPEVAALEARNTTADVWSLGCVYFEMAAAMKGYDVAWIKRHFSANCTGSVHYYANYEAASRLLSGWKITWSLDETIPLQWIQEMMQMNRMSRPTAATILEAITCCGESGHLPTAFCGICCVPDEETDSEDSLADVLSIMTLEERQPLWEARRLNGDSSRPPSGAMHRVSEFRGTETPAQLARARDGNIRGDSSAPQNRSSSTVSSDLHAAQNGSESLVVEDVYLRDTLTSDLLRTTTEQADMDPESQQGQSEPASQMAHTAPTAIHSLKLETPLQGPFPEGEGGTLRSPSRWSSDSMSSSGFSSLSDNFETHRAPQLHELDLSSGLDDHAAQVEVSRIVDLNPERHLLLISQDDHFECSADVGLDEDDMLPNQAANLSKQGCNVDHQQHDPFLGNHGSVGLADFEQNLHEPVAVPRFSAVLYKDPLPFEGDRDLASSPVFQKHQTTRSAHNSPRPSYISFEELSEQTQQQTEEEGSSTSLSPLHNPFRSPLLTHRPDCIQVTKQVQVSRSGRPDSLPLPEKSTLPNEVLAQKTSSWHSGWKKMTNLRVKSTPDTPTRQSGLSSSAAAISKGRVFGVEISRLLPTVLEPTTYGACPTVVIACCAVIQSQKTIDIRRLKEGDDWRVRSLMHVFNMQVRNSVDWKTTNVDVFDVETTLHRYLFALPGYLIPKESASELLGDYPDRHIVAYLNWYRRARSPQSTVSPSADSIVLQLLSVFQHMLDEWKIPLSDIVGRYYGVFFTPPSDEDERHRTLQRRALEFWIQKHRELWRVVTHNLDGDWVDGLWNDDMELLEEELKVALLVALRKKAS